MMTSNEYILSGPDYHQLSTPVSLGRYILDNIKNHGHRVAQVHGITGETAKYSDIYIRSLSVAEGLRTRGVKSGDVIGICSENNLEFSLTVLSALYIGATSATFNPTYTKRELLHALNISKPRLVFCSPATVGRFQEVARELGFIREIFTFGPGGPSGPIPFSSLVQNQHPRELVCDEDPDRVTVILCSSGTTGLPKGVMLTDKNILTAIEHVRDPRFTASTAEDVGLGILPFFHAYGYVSQLAALAIGLKLVILPKFEEQLFLKSIQNHKVTNLTLVPPLVVFLAKHPLVDQYDLSSLHSIGCGAAPLSQDIQEQVIKRLPSLKVIRQGYGMTETTLGVLLTPFNRIKFGSSGMLAPGTQCKVVDVDSGKPVGPNISGELCFKGPLMMKGYLGDPQATSASYDEEGFLHSGDIGYYDRDGFFFIVDRLKELIKYKGFQVPPAELEAILLTHPKVRDAAVIGIANEEAGELPLAFVVKQPGVSLTEEEVVEFVKAQVSPQKRLHGGVRFVDVIPKNPSGKILRRELREIVKSKL